MPMNNGHSGFFEGMPIYRCTVCLESREGNPKYIHRDSYWWRYHQNNRRPNLPPLVDNGEQCPPCYQRAYRKRKNENVVPPEPTVLEEITDPVEPTPNRVRTDPQPPVPGEGEVLVRCVARTQSCCCVCRKKDLPTQNVTGVVAACTWVAKEIYVPPKNRICKLHLQDGRFCTESLQKLYESSRLIVMRNEDLLERLKNLLTSAVQFIPEERKACLDFDVMEESDYPCYTGLTKHQFEEVLELISGRINDSCNRTKRNALAIFFCKLRMDLSHNQLGHLFGLDQQRISEIFHSVAEVLTAVYVPKHMGFEHVSRPDFIEKHTRILAKELLDGEEDTCILIMDGTYFEIQKSSNFELQRHTFSPHKHYNLVKIMVTCGTDGYILDAKDLYLGNNNDACILNSMLEPGKPLATFLQEGDVLILDRGFRDNRRRLEADGIRMAMPNTMRAGQKQFEDTEANESRMVTMLRWVVEAVNGRLKNLFKFFRNTINNKYLENGFLLKLLRIACAVINNFFQPIAPDRDGDMEKGQLVKEKAEIRNLLKELVIERRWHKTRVEFVSLDVAELLDFPKLSIEDLRDIQVGVYQIKMAKSYTGLHMKDGEYQFKIHRDSPDVIRVQIESRFRSCTVHTCWVGYRPYGEGPGSITGYYCQCQNGSRTLGCCGHVMSVIWFFGIGRHTDNLKFPAENLGASILDVRMRRQDLQNEEYN